MVEGVTFANYRLDQDGPEGIYDIGYDGGADNGALNGVIGEIATAFEHELTDEPSVENLGQLIGKVGPAKELQENIALVQAALGTNEDAVSIARSWAERSELLVPVERSYVTAETIDGPIDVAVITGGVRNWIARRLTRLEELHNEFGIDKALLIAGNRPMKTTEGPDVKEGMVEHDYMQQVALKRLTDMGILTAIVRAETGVGDEVMARGVAKAQDWKFVDWDSARLAVVSNAGAWPQNAGQFRRAVQAVVDPAFDHSGEQLFVVSDSFPLGTGDEPTATHQSPFSAVGQIARNAQELARYDV